MSDFGKLKITATYSEDAAHADPEWVSNWDDYDVTPDEGETRTVEAATGGTTVTISSYGTKLTLLMVKNTDPATGNKVTATWTDEDANSNTQKIPPGGVMAIPSVDPTAANLVLTAATAAVTCKVLMMGT